MATASNRKLYSQKFFIAREAGSRASAEAVVPIVLAIARPQSVIDVGCGDGSWLSVFNANGVSDFMGVDGSHVQPAQLRIPPANFRSHDLVTPFNPGRRFDLAMSVEVAEHLPPSSAEPFVQSLCEMSDWVMFSAAIPHQTGTGHINPQWQSYWADLFRSRGYLPFDVVRPKIWRDERVEPWYAQNILLYVKSTVAAHDAKLAELGGGADRAILDVVHPWFYVLLSETLEKPVGKAYSFPTVARALPVAFREAVMRRLRR